jgi:DNA-binding LacI/PurR family transcriptional regulator
MKPKPTLESVARLASVSPATVSRVINRSSRVSPDVEKRVRAAAAHLGFKLHRKRRTKLIAFLLGNRPLLHPFHSQVLVAAEAYCAAEDYNMLFFPLHYSPDQHWTKLHVPEVLRRSDVIDGFIVAGVNRQNLLDLLTHIGLPFAILGDTVEGDWSSQKHDVVWVDDTNGAYDATRYLQSLGHSQIAYVANLKLAWFARRCKGYSRAMEEAGMAPRVASINSHDEDEVGFLATKRILSEPNPPVEAIFAGSDAICHGVYRALREAGLAIPGDISVCGFNDTPEASLLYPPLTSARVFPEVIGHLLGEMVLARIADPQLPPQHQTLPTQLVKRESCQAARQPSIVRSSDARTN